MRTLTYYVAVSLDGRIAAADGDYSAFPAEGEHFAALIERFPETFPGPAREALGITGEGTRFDTVVMGWNTYAVGLPFGLVDPYPSLRTVVVTRDPAGRRGEALRAAADDESRGGLDAIEFADGDPLERVRGLKSDPSATGIWLCGGGELARALLPEIDRLVLKTNPIVLGGDGIPLFAAGSGTGAKDAQGGLPATFRLETTESFASGVTLAEYSRG